MALFIIFIMAFLIVPKGALKSTKRVNAAMGGVVVLLFIFGKPDHIDNRPSYANDWNYPPS